MNPPVPSPAVSLIDVLVVGAGPAGLTTALGLTRAGIKVRIVDIRAQRVLAGHADGVLPRTIEILDSYGISNELLRKGHYVNAFSNYNHDPPTGGIKVGIVSFYYLRYAGKFPAITEPTARYKHAVTHHQGFIEGLFLSGLKDAGVLVERPCEPVSLELSSNEDELKDPTSYPVKITLEHHSAAPGMHSSETVCARFLVGADGAHSWVRRTLGIPMEGDSTDRVWGAIDFTPLLSSNFPDWRNVATVNAADGGLMIIPREDNKVRLYIELSNVNEFEHDERGRLDTSTITADKLLDIARHVLKPYTLETTLDKVEWWTVYVVGQRVAARFCDQGRAFITGDACHTHSPKGGQGMNASVNDGHNLAWKLAYVVKGWSPMALLDTYEAERRTFAQELIAFDKWFAEGFSAKARAKLVEDGSDVVLPGPLEAFGTFSGLTTGLGIQYAPSIITSQVSHAANGVKTEISPFTLTVGKRVPPYAFVRVADCRPINLQDALPSDGLTKLIVFAGPLTSLEEKNRLVEVERALRNILDAFGADRFLLLVILSVISDDMNYMDVPVGLRKDWTSVLVDAVSAFSKDSGGAYTAFGVPAAGQLVVVRPDGYIGTIVELSEMQRLGEYLRGWML
ncbi:uncharacterized protein PHACADRAFT_202149 [Phanerochaete carnosa HHB-10118-sp]|uniref:FAD-binding domain-containing protein n=1 Tax=Phanerochaete carnosa (strain HHB-10118-sp) TaxID=650164 RepID=K5VQZ3_PHACS|nr:uncharacterized protein PHACADRAFT_202149 [Phanerochaete carnosa HHB-10118-sp]EKM48994.1 hypothetical protein PHACADRAFT_202149 [Phanerochaete carnosa HHB-10118-sp]